MRLTIVAVGRLRAGPEQALVEAYLKRLGPGATLREVAETRAREATLRRAGENRLLRQAIPRGARVVALDARGQTLTSEAFARRLGGWRDGGVGEVAFLIGGAEGLEAETLDAADLVLSLGAMTWPHLLARVMLAEQLYRAMSILAGHPYHRAGQG